MKKEKIIITVWKEKTWKHKIESDYSKKMTACILQNLGCGLKAKKPYRRPIFKKRKNQKVVI